MVTQQLEASKQEYLQRLEERRLRLRKRQTISVRGKELGPEPTNEHEVLILAGKMESAFQEVLSEFQILEHTAQIDIDGIVRIQRGPGQLLQGDATVEFEYELRSFFEHRHPIPMTNYIICWTLGGLEEKSYSFGSQGLQEEGPPTVEISPLGWMKLLKFAEHMIYVIPLEHFPGLTFALPPGEG
jgi:hypothetical protein